MIEILELLTPIKTTLARIVRINTEVNLTCKISYTVDLISEIIPEMEEVSEINLEEV